MMNPLTPPGRKAERKRKRCIKTRGRQVFSAIAFFLAALLVWEPEVGGAERSNSAKAAGVAFVDATSSVGLNYRVEEDSKDRDDLDGSEEAGGLALFDVDGDGGLELYVAHGKSEKGRLFSWSGRRFARQDGNAGIAPTAMDRAGYFFDLDQDGRFDFISLHNSGVQVSAMTATGDSNRTGRRSPAVGIGAYSMAAPIMIATATWISSSPATPCRATR